MTTSGHTASFDGLVDWARARGLDLVGVVDPHAFDGCQPAGRRASDHVPDCESIIVLGSGGRRCWEHLNEIRPAEFADGPAEGHHPIDRWSLEVAEELAGALGDLADGHSIVLPNDDRTLNFVQLAEMAGFGTVSPVIHQLLHPDYGPWVSLRAALLLRTRPFAPFDPTTAAPFEPCHDCHKPCLLGCPVDAYSSTKGPFSVCADHRIAGGCADGCGVRRDCCIGREHRYGPNEEAFRHAYSLYVMRQIARGRGLLGIVRSLWRRR
ncbi:MAG: hypothetical protein KDB80_11955 [Planctomycetes bacterium]|nr:hypothetical protein [Planctomycetota bacterium]